MNPRVVNANALDNYQLLIKFSNGESGVFDVTPYLDYPAFSRLRDKGLFGLVKVNHGTVCWLDNIDICPDTIYLKSRAIGCADERRRI